MRECHSCAARADETAMAPIRWGRRGGPAICVDCAAESAKAAEPLPRKPITRARYRAALRARQASAQTDLVDLLVPSP